MKAPAIVSGDGSGPSVSAGTDASRTRTLRKLGARAVLDLVGVEVELVAADADQPDVEDEVRIGPCREQLDQRRLAGDGRGVELELLEPGPADLALARR